MYNVKDGDGFNVVSCVHSGAEVRHLRFTYGGNVLEVGSGVGVGSSTGLDGGEENGVSGALFGAETEVADDRAETTEGLQNDAVCVGESGESGLTESHEVGADFAFDERMIANISSAMGMEGPDFRGTCTDVFLWGFDSIHLCSSRRRTP